MGFVHETESEIFGIETRSESAYLHDLEGCQVFIYETTRGADVREDGIMKQAGEHFAKGGTKEAERFKQIADIVRGTPIRPDREHHLLEASYIWIAALVKFCNENATMRGHLESAQQTSEVMSQTREI